MLLTMAGLYQPGPAKSSQFDYIPLNERYNSGGIGGIWEILTHFVATSYVEAPNLAAVYLGVSF